MTAKQDGLSHPDKVLFPDPGVTKANLADYFDRVADVMLPHLAGRPLVLRRYPDGLDGQGFVRQRVPQGVPDFVATATVAADNREGEVRHVVVKDADTLRFLATRPARSCTGGSRVTTASTTRTCSCSTWTARPRWS